MIRAVTSWAAVGLVVGLTCGPARAENPRVHLKLENVTAAQAAEALGKAASVRIEITPASPPQEGSLQEKNSFDWSDITFANALRQLTTRYPLSMGLRMGNAYQLHPVGAARPAAVYQNLVQKDGIRVFLRSISISSGRSINFEAHRDADFGSMGIAVGVELLNGDAESIIGLSNVVARDDQGNILAQDGSTGGIMFGSGFPDEWSGSVLVPTPFPKARKLAWLEGELVGYRVYRKHDLELPLDTKGKPVPFQGGTVELSRFEPSPSIRRPASGVQDYRVEARITLPPGGSASLDPLSSFRLIGKSGRVYSSQNRAMSTTGDRDGTRMRVECIVDAVDEPIEHVKLVTVERSDPQRLLAFRMTDIPLPQEAPFVPRKRPVLRTAPEANVPTHRPEFAFRQVEGGGALVTSINVAGHPVAQGTLSLGLAVKEGNGWGPNRWTDVEVQSDGTARLNDLKPGTYRVVRVFRGKEEMPLPPGGRWENGEVMVTVLAGKEVRVPPLMWAVPAPAALKR